MGKSISTWWYSKITPPGYEWKPNTSIMNVKPNLVEIILFIVEFMMGNLKLLSNFVEKFLGTVKFGNDQIAPILGYGEMVQGNITIKRVYYVDELNHNLFFVGQFCDADLEVAFRKSTCYISDLKGNDLLTGSCGTYLYSITLQDTSTPNPICLMAKASSSQAWLWHRYLSHLNFDTINLVLKYDIVTGLPKLKFVKYHLCSSSSSSQAWLWHRRLSHLNFDTINLLLKYDIVIGLPKLKFVKDHLGSSCELGKAKRKSFKTKTTPSSKRHLQILHIDLWGPMRIESFNVRTVQINKGTESLNKTHHVYFAQEGIEHQTSTARTPEQNGIVKRRNRTIVEGARTMLSIAKVPLFFWAEAIATTCFTQNRSLIIPRHEKTPYHIINGQKPSIKFLYIFGSLCYIVRDGENLDKMKEKGDAFIFISSNPIPQCPTMALEQDNLSLGPQSQETIPQSDEIVTTSNELDLLFSPMFDELLNGTTIAVSKSSAVTAADAPDQRQQHNKTLSTSITVAADTPPLNIQTTPVTTSQAPTQAPTVTATENINQAETQKQNAQAEKDEFINIFKHCWTKDHLLEQVIGNPSQSIRTRRQQETDGKMCMFALSVSRTEPKNIKEAMADSAWIEAMQEELHQFD
ncbi:retrovirus-related pol polyprotein from transposon TNT 1-94 [Tanacetum coccineum]